MDERCQMTRFTAAALVATLALTSGFDYAVPGTRVQLKKTQLNFYCSGTGTPVVLMEAGLGGRASQWKSVAEPLATVTTVCSYDRAGYGFSSAGPFPRTSAQIASELWEAVRALRLNGPYILVGTSFGVFDLRLFAKEHPNAVAGAVLVNPSAAEEELEAADPAIVQIDANGLNNAKRCLAAARTGDLKTNSTMAQECIGQTDDSAAGRVRRQLLSEPTFWSALVSEWSSIRLSAQEVFDSSQRFGDRPLIVISTGKDADYTHTSKAQRLALIPLPGPMGRCLRHSISSRF